MEQFIKGLGSLVEDFYFILKEAGSHWQVLSKGSVMQVHGSDNHQLLCEKGDERTRTEAERLVSLRLGYLVEDAGGKSPEREKSLE